jgi:hypothetical protein
MYTVLYRYVLALTKNWEGVHQLSPLGGLQQAHYLRVQDWFIVCGKRVSYIPLIIVVLTVDDSTATVFCHYSIVVITAFITLTGIVAFNIFLGIFVITIIIVTFILIFILILIFIFIFIAVNVNLDSAVHIPFFTSLLNILILHLFFLPVVLLFLVTALLLFADQRLNSAISLERLTRDDTDIEIG